MLTIEGFVVGEWLMAGEKRWTKLSCHEVSREREGCEDSPEPSARGGVAKDGEY